MYRDARENSTNEYIYDWVTNFIIIIYRMNRQKITVANICQHYIAWLECDKQRYIIASQTVHAKGVLHASA